MAATAGMFLVHWACVLLAPPPISPHLLSPRRLTYPKSQSPPERLRLAGVPGERERLWGRVLGGRGAHPAPGGGGGAGQGQGGGQGAAPARCVRASVLPCVRDRSVCRFYAFIFPHAGRRHERGDEDAAPRAGAAGAGQGAGTGVCVLCVCDCIERLHHACSSATRDVCSFSLHAFPPVQ